MKYQLLLLADKQDDQVSKTVHAGFDTTIVHDVETALEKLHQSIFDAIIYDESISPIDENKLDKISRVLQEEIILSRKDVHTTWDDSISGALQLLKKLQSKKIIITDDALKNAMFNINLN